MVINDESLLEVTLPQHPFDGLVVRFKIPSSSQVAIHANRLLRFRPPVPYWHEAHLRFLLPLFHTPGVSARMVELWPEVWLEQVVQALWCQGLEPGGRVSQKANNGDLPGNLWLGQTICQFSSIAWCRADLALLAQLPHGRCSWTGL